MKAQVLIFFASICVLFYSCGSDEKISREVFEEVQKANEVKKLSEVDIFNEALKWGEEISAEAQQQLRARLEQAIEEKGTSGAVEFCATQVLPILKEVGERHGVMIRRVSKEYLNPADQPLEEEKMILEAYKYNEQNGIRHQPNLQKIKDGSVLLFTKAIIHPDGLCFNYHREPDKNIDEEILRKISPSNPEDEGQAGLRGMWSIAISQKAIVDRL